MFRRTLDAEMTSVRRALSGISFRLLAFNVLLVFLPAAGVLFLDTYEQHLLEAQERTMGQEGRLFAAAMEAAHQIDSDHAKSVLIQLGQRHLARLRVVDDTGTVLADSAILGPRRESESADPAPPNQPAQRTLLYRIGSLPVRLLRALGAPAPVGDDAFDIQPTGQLLGPEVNAALEGRYGAATRVMDDPARTVILHIAIPIRIDGEVAGAVVVSQSTSRIMSALYAVRLDVFQVFLASFAVAIVLTLLMATTIARPLARLRHRAEDILDRRGRLRGGFEPSHRSDEIGDLERALSQLTRRLEEHLQYTEAFASDVSHEFKNPLAAIRTAADMALEVSDPEEQRRFLGMIQGDIARMERLLTEAREISRVDARLDEEERAAVAVDGLLTGLLESFRLRRGDTGPGLELTVDDPGVLVKASPDRLIQVFENLIENAISFSPPTGTISVAVHSAGATVEVTVADQGPGIPPEHMDRIFTRFFSYRTVKSPEDGHTGIGLALVKAIVEGYGGTVVAGNHSGGGAEFVVTLPRLVD
jgi:two-component system sensor histidine kinase ChvG